MVRKQGFWDEGLTTFATAWRVGFGRVGYEKARGSVPPQRVGFRRMGYARPVQTGDRCRPGPTSDRLRRRYWFGAVELESG